MQRRQIILAASWMTMAVQAVCARDENLRALKELSVDQLLDLEVTSVAKRTTPLADAPTSIYVITAEAIRRAGADTLAGALRLAPTLQVARIDSVQYAISARGFNNAVGNKLLVLIDGRTVYTPLYSGVFWDQQDLMMADVERIEVISGPGAALWGVNAVNGVINVITRPAKNTQGGLVTAGTGNRDTNVALRYGGTLGGDGNYRVYGKFSDNKHTSTAIGTAKDDAWSKSQAGFRADWDRAGEQVTVHGNAYRGTEGQPPPGSISTGAIFTLGDIEIFSRRWFQSGTAGLLRPNRADCFAYVLRSARYYRSAGPALISAIWYPLYGMGRRVPLRHGPCNQ
jgi:iron complex outermembrane receptor protein